MIEADHSPEAKGPMVEIVHIQKQEVVSALCAAMLVIERKLQSAERPIKSATIATRKAILPKCAMHQEDLTLRVKEIQFS
jgi:hypothetical protein